MKTSLFQCPVFSIQSASLEDTETVEEPVAELESRLEAAKSKHLAFAAPGIIRKCALTAALCLLLAGLALTPAWAAGASIFQAVTDQITYDAGSEVSIRIRTMSAPTANSIRLVASVRYRGTGSAPGPAPAARTVLFTGTKPPDGYVSLWKIPADASTGRYDIDLGVEDPDTGHAREGQAKVASFAVHRKLVRINTIDLDKSFYTSGDPVSVKVS